MWLWSECAFSLSFTKLALPIKSERTGFGAKVGLLLRLKRSARRNTDPQVNNPEQSYQPQTEHASLNIPHATSPEPSPPASPSQQPNSLPSPHTMLSSGSQPHPPPPPDFNPPHTKASLKAWWNHFHFIQKTKKEAFDVGPYKAHDTADHPVFGKPLKESLRYASVQISTADANGDLYVWGYIPVVVAKCGLYLKENATEVPGTFRVNGSNKRMRDLQAAFETPPRYGKNLDWKNEQYTTHDVASVFRRYLTQMPEPVIPYDMYHLFRDTLDKQPYNQEEVITTYKSLIRRMPRANQYLLLYVLDLLSVFARKSDKNLMTATNLAVIFRPGIISHPKHEMSPHAHALSQKVLEFLIAQQDWFMLDIIPPPPAGGFPGDDDDVGAGQGGSTGSGAGGPGAGPSRSGGAPGGGTGKWREGTSTPTRQGAMDSAWTANAEAGPSLQRTTTRQRVLSGSPDVGARQTQNRGAGALSHGYTNQLHTLPPQPTRNNSYPNPNPYPYSPSPIPPASKSTHIRRASLQVELVRPHHQSNLAPAGSSNIHENVRRNPSPHGVVIPQLSSDHSGEDGTVFVTPMSSPPPSPNGSSNAGKHSSGHGHDQRQGHFSAQQFQQKQTQTTQLTSTSTRRSPYIEPQVSHTRAGSGVNGQGVTPIYSRLAHTDPHSTAFTASVQRPQISSNIQFQSSYSPQSAQKQPQWGQSSPPQMKSFPQEMSLPHGLSLGWAAPLGSGASDVDDVMVIPSEEEESHVGSDPWKLIPNDYSTITTGGGGGFLSLGGRKDNDRERKESERARHNDEKERRAIRRRTTMERSEIMITSKGQDIHHASNGMLPIQEGSSSSTTNGTVIYGLVRSRTLPSRRKGLGGDPTVDNKENANSALGDNGELATFNGNAREKAKDRERHEKKVLKKQRRVSSTNRT